MTTKVTPAGQVFSWTAVTATSGQFLYVAGNNATSTASESTTRIVLARPGVLRRLAALCGANTTLTVRVGLADSLLVLNATANTYGIETTIEVEVTAAMVAAGAYLTLKASGTAGNAVFASCEYA